MKMGASSSGCHPLADPTTRFHDLGSDDHTNRIVIERKLRNHLCLSWAFSREHACSPRGLPRRNGRFPTMRTTIDAAGRLVIPKRIRDRLGLRGNEQVEITERDGRIEIEPAPTDVELVRDGSVLVARPERPLPPLTDDMVREALDRVRR